jgi:ribosomal protein L7Ae-like RNA K-turn-binding protein
MVPHAEQFILDLAGAIKRKIASLLSMATKSHKAVSGFSAVDDAIQKRRVAMLLFSRDLSDGTRGKVLASGRCVPDRQVTIFTKLELGALVGRDEAGVVGILDRGFSNAIWRESERLKGLIKEQL